MTASGMRGLAEARRRDGAPVPTGASPPRIGPNAVIRVAEALRECAGEEATTGVFREAGLARYLDRMPEEMVDEHEVTRLHAALRARLGAGAAGRVAFSAGQRTGDYLLAHRIPRPAQRLLRALPAALASRLLLAAIRRNAWTFAGSGLFSASAHRREARLSIADCPVCRGLRGTGPACDFYAGTFERLFRELVDDAARAVETDCQATGAAACAFRVNW